MSMEVEREKLYTLRWLVKQFTKESAKEAQDMIGEMLGENPTAIIPTRVGAFPRGEKLLHVPFAKQYAKKSRTRGGYQYDYPQGAVVHFTAGHPTQKGEDALDLQVKQGYTYFFIDNEGVIWQNFPLNEWGYHAGESKWPGLGESVHKKLVGIEIANAGKLDSDLSPWFNKVALPSDEIRKVPGLDNMEEGSYQKFTVAQEESLTKLLLWLYHNNPNVFQLDYVLGHDEVSGPTGLGWRRKNDPGGALSMTMPKFRQKLKNLSVQ